VIIAAEWTIETRTAIPRLGIDEGVLYFLVPVEIGGAAETKIDRHEDQPRAMSDRHGKGPEPQLRRSYARQHPRMASADHLEDAEPDNQDASANLDLSLPLDEGEQQRERKDHYQHRQQMAER
jgi:hypothetical protein